MNFKQKAQPFNPAALPMEHFPQIPEAYDDKHARHYLIPGKIFAAAQAFAISTILGSSVALCLWDSAHGIGGINHFMLPEGPNGGEDSPRYANVANRTLLEQMLALGADRKSLEARVFGGSVPTVTFANAGDCVGIRNVQAVTQFVHMNGIRLLQSEVGGTRGRKLVFHTDDGRVWSELI